MCRGCIKTFSADSKLWVKRFPCLPLTAAGGEAFSLVLYSAEGEKREHFLHELFCRAKIREGLWNCKLFGQYDPVVNVIFFPSNQLHV